jgi:hypothetical protein
MNDADPLRAKLIEDTGSPEEADQLLPVLRRLPDWSAPAPTARSTAQLIAMLQAQAPITRQSNLLRLGLLIRSQARVIQPEIWLATALVMTLGVFVTLATAQPQVTIESLPFVYIAPIVAAIGLAFLYGPGLDPASEIEVATPTSPRLVFLTRLMLVFGFNLGLGLIGTLLLAVGHTNFSAWPLIESWLAPMACLSALTVLGSVLFVDPLISTAAGLLAWGIFVSQQFIERTAMPLLAHLPNLASAEARPFLFGLALTLSAAAVWLAGREERWLRRQV